MKRAVGAEPGRGTPLLSDAETGNVGKRQCLFEYQTERLFRRHTGDINCAHYRARFLRLSDLAFVRRRLLRCTDPVVAQ